MCELAEGLKLCTCEDGGGAQDWVLERRDESLPERHRRGRAMMPKYSDREQECLEKVLAQLNEGACFDFDYAPRRGDVLTLKHQSKRYRFRFEAAGWTLDRSTSLTGWRAQMVRAKTGRLS